MLLSEVPKEEKRKKRKSTPLKKAIMAQRALAPPSEAWAKFDVHLQKFNQNKVAESANDEFVLPHVRSTVMNAMKRAGIDGVSRRRWRGGRRR